MESALGKTRGDANEPRRLRDQLQHTQRFVFVELFPTQPQLLRRFADRIVGLLVAEGLGKELGEIRLVTPGSVIAIVTLCTCPLDVRRYFGNARTTVVVLWNPDRSPASSAISPYVSKPASGTWPSSVWMPAMAVLKSSLRIKLRQMQSNTTAPASGRSPTC